MRSSVVLPVPAGPIRTESRERKSCSNAADFSNRAYSSSFLLVGMSGRGWPIPESTSLRQS
jgi:hypothetical protein